MIFKKQRVDNKINSRVVAERKIYKKKKMVFLL